MPLDISILTVLLHLHVVRILYCILLVNLSYLLTSFFLFFSLPPSAAATPPLSPNSGYSSHSPHSPGPRSPISPNPSQLSRSSTSTARPPAIATPRTPSPAGSNATNKVPFFEKFKDKVPPVSTTMPYDTGIKIDSSPMSPSSGSDYGLAYAESSDEEDNELAKRLPTPPPASVPTSKSNQVRFPSVDEKSNKSALKKSASSSSGSSGSGLNYASASVYSGRERSNSAASASASNYSRSTTKSTHAIEKAMETLFEEGSSSPSGASNVKGKSQRSNTIPGLEPLSPEHKPPKLPTRSLTSPSAASFEESKRSKARRKKECMRCETTIEDGRWIQTDSGGVLCERCWKNMYLPKVCSLHL